VIPFEINYSCSKTDVSRFNLNKQNVEGIRTWIESQSYGAEKLVPPGASKISARITEYDKYTVVADVPLIGWAEHRHTIFRCKVKGLDQNGENFSRIRFVDWHYYYMLDDVESGAGSTQEFAN
jgi:hypothetical protein